MKTLNTLKVICGAAALMLTSAALAQGAMTDGEVRKVDKENQKITLKHGEIKNQEMPPMTMVFNVGDAKLLDNVKTGDKVQFRAVSEGGKFTITEIQPAK